jgi:ABC-type Zn uptake system ZnuABC Zn-binding protein ZnuA
MNILETLVQLRDDLKTWVTNNLNALNKKIDEKTIPIDSELSTTSTNPV